MKRTVGGNKETHGNTLPTRRGPKSDARVKLANFNTGASGGAATLSAEVPIMRPADSGNKETHGNTHPKSDARGKLENFNSGASDGAATLSAEELEADKRALNKFQVLLRELVSKASDGSAYERDRRKFDELVGKYASLLPVLELPSGLVYCETALIGLDALQARRLGISKEQAKHPP
jgi:hypothetical protein